ncbi:GNAT family N-acetyltransferase [Aquihabitans sp. McL0605]|uniref:GNAT family N-acetyltransferase n=1 Tax=Aquihabitans sp. McL0605 TaxID=3415671 RepID=UPI003CF6BFF4
MLIPPVVPPGQMAASPQPVIVGDGIRLRPWAPDDADVVLEAFEVPDIQHWHFRRLDSVEEAEGWIAATETGWRTEVQAHWAIVAAPGPDRPVGRIALRPELAAGAGEISYWLLPSARGTGTATRATLALTAWAFAELGLHRLELNHSTQNPASCRVAERAGFAAEGTRRSAQLLADGWHDLHAHARIG